MREHVKNKNQVLQLTSLKLLTSIALVLLISALHCKVVTAINVEITPVKNSILLDEAALYNITISNDKEFPITAHVSSGNDVRWVYITKPSAITVNPGQEVTALLEVYPKKSLLLEGLLGPGPYQIPVVITFGKTKLSYTTFLRLKSYTELEKEYLPAVKVQVSVPEVVDPRKKALPVDISLSNRNLLNLTGLKIHVKTDLFEKTLTIDLKPLQETSQRIIFPIKKQQEPGTYSLTLDVVLKNETLTSVKKEFRIIPYQEVNVELVKKTSFLLKTVEVYKIKNNGNARAMQFQALNKNWFSRIFTTTEPKAEKLLIEGRKQYGWQLILDPGQEETITITTNYRLPVLIVILALIVIGLYYLLRSPIVLKKEVKILGSKKELSEFRVLIHLKNRSASVVKNVKVIDRIPSIVEVVKEHALGTVKPSKIAKHPDRGEVITWHIDSLEPFEERILSYKLKSKLKIIGGLKLKPTKAKFEVRNKQDSVESNAVIVK